MGYPKHRADTIVTSILNDDILNELLFRMMTSWNERCGDKPAPYPSDRVKHLAVATVGRCESNQVDP
jgi:hypothetical protein